MRSTPVSSRENSEGRILKLGTRRSLLAWTQSSWVARQIESIYPKIKVELVGIETQGDRIQDVPLSKIEGKEFFVAELDQALLAKKVDFTVHSLKDLSLDRPKGIRLAALPKRENSRDVLFFHPRVLDKIKSGQEITIGTSSPRRLENIPKALLEYLPRFYEHGGDSQKPAEVCSAIRMRCVEIRGNVNTRLRKLSELDAVVLAYAGVLRLTQALDPKVTGELSTLLQQGGGLLKMVLPLNISPGAAGQGVLAVECRADDDEVFRYIQSIHDPISVAQAKAERDILAHFGGGCHQRFGVASSVHKNLGPLMWIKGQVDCADSKVLDECRWAIPSGLNGNDLVAGQSLSATAIMAGNHCTFKPKPLSEEDWIKLDQATHLFVSQERALSFLKDQWQNRIAQADIKKGPIENWKTFIDRKSLWVAGHRTWKKLAEQGYWVEGSAEGLGYSWFEEQYGDDGLNCDLPGAVRRSEIVTDGAPRWAYLMVESNEKNSVEKSGFKKDFRLRYGIETYSVTLREGHEGAALNDLVERILKSKILFWASGGQYELLKSHLPATKNWIHCCGPGETAETLKRQGLNVVIFPSVKEWKLWLTSQHIQWI